MAVHNAFPFPENKPNPQCPRARVAHPHPRPSAACAPLPASAASRRLSCQRPVAHKHTQCHTTQNPKHNKKRLPWARAQGPGPNKPKPNKPQSQSGSRPAAPPRAPVRTARSMPGAAVKHISTDVWAPPGFLRTSCSGMKWPCSCPNAPSALPSTSNRCSSARVQGTYCGGWRRCACLDAKTRVLAVGALASTTCNNFIADLLFLSEVSRFCLVAGAPCVHPYLGKSALQLQLQLQEMADC
jgi:hypothetical protein